MEESFDAQEYSGQSVHYRRDETMWLKYLLPKSKGRKVEEAKHLTGEFIQLESSIGRIFCGGWSVGASVGLRKGCWSAGAMSDGWNYCRRILWPKEGNVN